METHSGKWWILRGLLLLLIIESAFLAWENHTLKRKHAYSASTGRGYGCNYAPGDTLPDIEGELIDGSQYHLTFPREIPVLLSFFSVECPACDLDADNWNWLHEVSERNDFLLVAVCSGDSLSRVQIFAANRGFSFPILYDPMSALKAEFGVASIPLKVFVSSKGMVEQISRGARTIDSYHRTLRDLGWLLNE